MWPVAEVNAFIIWFTQCVLEHFITTTFQKLALVYIHGTIFFKAHILGIKLESSAHKTFQKKKLATQN